MQIKILSWNIWIDSYFDKVKEFLKNSNTDIISLQEVREDDPLRETVKFLESQDYHYVFSPITEVWNGNIWNYGPAIFSKFRIVSTEKYLLGEGNKRIAVRANIKIGKKMLCLFNTHLTHTHQKESVAQLKQVEDLLKQIPSKNTILMGDFNAIPTSMTIQKVKSLLVDTDLNNHPTWSIYPEGCTICNPRKTDIRLDYIFTTKDIKTHSYKVEHSQGSDHLPISVQIDL